jgi:hypothetical protein
MGEDLVTIQVSVLRALVGAAESYAEDLESGLEDGTYDNPANLNEVQDAIEIADANLAEFD